MSEPFPFDASRCANCGAPTVKVWVEPEPRRGLDRQWVQRYVPPARESSQELSLLAEVERLRKALQETDSMISSLTNWPVRYFSDIRWHRAWRVAADNARARIDAALVGEPGAPA